MLRSPLFGEKLPSNRATATNILYAAMPQDTNPYDSVPPRDVVSQNRRVPCPRANCRATLGKQEDLQRHLETVHDEAFQVWHYDFGQKYASKDRKSNHKKIDPGNHCKLVRNDWSKEQTTG
jgi:hypothetical protein